MTTENEPPTGKDRIEEQIIQLYPNDVEYLKDLRYLMGDKTFTDEFIDNPRDDLDTILPSRRN